MANFPFTVQSLQIGQSLLTSTGSTLNIPAGSSIDGSSSGPKISGLIITNISNTQLDDTAIDLSGGYVRLIGTGFQSGCLIYVGQTPAASTTFISATEVRAQLSAQPAGTYILYLINPDGGAAVKVPGITYSASPNWQTGSTLPDMYVSVAITLGLMATNATSYSLISGGLPPGLTLDGNTGVISGSITGITNDTVYSFTIAAIDSENQDSPRVFTLNVRIGDPYFKYTTLLLPGNGTNGAQNNTFLDSSTNNFTITRNGNTTQGNFSPFSQTGWGNYFNGTNAYLTASNASLAFGSGDFTIECWIYATSSPSDKSIFEGRTNGSGTTGFTITAFTGTSIRVFSGSQVLIATSINYVNTWCHVALVKSSGTTTLYINGESKATTTSLGNLTDSSWMIGAGKYSAPPAVDAFFPGYISNFRTVNGRAVYTSNFTPPTSPLTRTTGGTNPPQGTECSLLTCQSNRFLDSNGPNTPASSPLTITVNGNPSVQAFSPFNPTATWYAVTNGGSGYFDGTGDYLSCGDILDFAGSNFTVSCFIYFETINNQYTTIFSKWGVPPEAYQFLWDSSNNRWLWSIRTDPNTYTNLYFSDTIRAGEWYYICVERTGSSYKLYKNGVQVGSTQTLSGNISNSSGNFLLGYTTGDSGQLLYPFKGYISSFRVVVGDNSPITPPTAPLTAITNTQLLLNFTNSGIYDATSRNVLETVGGAQISTAQSKWGGSSMYFDGTGDYLFGPATKANDFGTGNFTIECWIRFASVGNAQIITSGGGSVTGAYYWQYYSSELQFGINFVGNIANPGWTPSANQWYHLAVTRNGTTIKQFVDGTQLGGNATSSYAFVDSFTQVAYGGAGYLNGYIQDLRVTKGYARYTSNFTVPTSAFTTQ